VVHRLPTALLVVPLEEREVGHPEEAPSAPVDEVELTAEMETERPQDASDHLRLVRTEQDRRRGPGAEVVELLLREELRDRRAHLALLVVHEVREPLRPPFLGERLQPLEVGARELLRHSQEANSRRVREDAELRAARHGGRVLDLEPEAQVRLVGAVASLCFVPCHPLEAGLDLDADRVAPDALHRPLAQLEDELPVGERHLDVELGQLL